MKNSNSTSTNSQFPTITLNTSKHLKKYQNPKLLGSRGEKMGRIIAKNVVERKAGFLYYVDGKGNVCEAKMSRGGRKKKKTSSRKKTTTKKKTTKTTKRR